MDRKTPIPGTTHHLPHLGPGSESLQNRERFERDELAVVLSHYDLGVVNSAKSFPRGSRRAPKVRITSETGEYLLKRRASGHDEPDRVAFSHELQSYLASKDYPIAPLIAMRGSNNTVLRQGGRIYELFRFMPGRRFGNTTNDAWEAGIILGRLHALLGSFSTRFAAPSSSFHAIKGISNKINRIPTMVQQIEGAASRQDMDSCCKLLRRVYREAAKKSEQLGFGSWESSYLHGDWHPGNLLFNGDVICSVLDFDSARIEPRAVEVANAILQFSMRMGSSSSLSKWPKGLDVSLIEAMASGYQASSGRPLSPEECQAIPWLMIEAVVAESVYPIAATGMFGKLPGSAFLGVVREKVNWIKPRSTSLAELLETS